MAGAAEAGTECAFTDEREQRKDMEMPVSNSEGFEPRLGRSVSLDQAAQLLGVSRRTVYYRIRDGTLRTIRTRCGSQRVLIESIEGLLRAEAAPATVRDVGVSSTGPFERSPEP